MTHIASSLVTHQRVMKSVPPAVAGSQHCQLSIADCHVLSQPGQLIGNWKSAISETHPLPRGGTDLTVLRPNGVAPMRSNHCRNNNHESNHHSNQVARPVFDGE